MYERFTDRARKVMAMANQEAQRLNHEYIGTEHILLGLVKEGSGVGANVLRDFDIDLQKVRLEVEKLINIRPDMVIMGKLPQTPRAKKVIEFAIEEARNLNHNYVGTEHLLLGLLREHDGVAAQVLMYLGLKLEEVREEIFNRLGAGVESEEPQQSSRFSLVHKPPVAPIPHPAYYTETVRNALRSSLVAAWSWSKDPINTGHILIGLLREKDSVAAKVLAKIGLTEEMVKQELTGEEP
jgi:ATP-dependent Clp protease ATP-binding subunit ClpA